MGLTIFSFVMLPLSLLWTLKPTRLLQLLIVAGVFEAAAALTVGGLGVQPGLVPAIFFISYVSLQLLLGAQYPGSSKVLQLLTPFILVTLWALASSYLMPRVFEDKVFVWPQKGTPPFVLVALEPSPTNFNQDFYLLVNSVLLVLSALFLTRSRLRLTSLLNAFFASGFIAAGIGFWQLANRLTGVPYPDALLYSNPGWAILTEQQIGAVPRINGSFSEPAALGGYMAACVCATGWLMLQGNRQVVVRLLFCVGLLSVTVSTSTTGFAALAVAAATALAFGLLSGSGHLLGRILKIGFPLLLLVGFLVVVTVAFAPTVIDRVHDVFTVTMNKQESSSYQDRTSADADSIQATIDSYGFGAGWGSNRSSSLVPGLLAGLGVPGVLGLLWFGVSLTDQVRRARRMAPTPDQLMVIDGCCGAIFGFLVAALISTPTLNSLTFFFLLALLIGCVARVELDARKRGFAGRIGRRKSPLVGRDPASALSLTPHRRSLRIVIRRGAL